MERLTDTIAPAASVYVIGLRDSQRDLPYTKVGVSGCIESRIKAMSTSIPFDIFLHASAGFETRSDAMDAEAAVHKKLNNLHVRGEWFAGGPSVHMANIREVVSHIERYRKPSVEQALARAVPQSPVKKQPPDKPKKLFKYELKMIQNGIQNSQNRRKKDGWWLPKYPPRDPDFLQ